MSHPPFLRTMIAGSDFLKRCGHPLTSESFKDTCELYFDQAEPDTLRNWPADRAIGRIAIGTAELEYSTLKAELSLLNNDAVRHMVPRPHGERLAGIVNLALEDFAWLYGDLYSNWQAQWIFRGMEPSRATPEQNTEGLQFMWDVSRQLDITIAFDADPREIQDHHPAPMYLPALADLIYRLRCP